MSIRLVIESLDGRISCEKHFPSDLQFEQFKERLECVFGSSSQSMQVMHNDQYRKFIRNLSNCEYNSRSLCELGIDNYHIITIGFTDVTNQNFTAELNSVVKFELDRKDYEKRSDSFYQWKQRNCPNPVSRENTMEIDDSFPAGDSCPELNIQLGMRCFVTSASNPKLGTVRWIGKLDNDAGQVFVGVELDFPVGMHDGVFKGKRLFSTKSNHAVFTKPANIRAFSDFDDMEEEL